MGFFDYANTSEQSSASSTPPKMKVSRPEKLQIPKLAEPEMPDVHVPVEFMDRIAQTRIDAARFEENVAKLKETSV